MKRKLVVAAMVLAMVGMMGIVSWAVAVEEEGQAPVTKVKSEEPAPKATPTTERAPAPRGNKKYQAQLEEVLSAIKAAKEAMSQGDKEKATTELDKAAAIVAEVHKAMMPRIANKTCPVTGNAVDPNAETRDYKGKRIGFCCAECPGKWDAMTDEQKDAALKPAAKKTEEAPME